MTASLPDYYFRIRENGAAVFRLDTENRQHRIEMDQIAVLNIRNGEIRPQGNRTLSDADMAAIREWMDARQAHIDEREMDDIQRTVEHLNLAAQWAQSRATPEQLEEITDTVLLAMHDLRAILVRKKALGLRRDSR